MVQEHKLAQMITERVESVEQVIFTCSASEACMVAVRVARAYTGKPRLAKMEGGFHGIGDDFLVWIQPEPLSAGRRRLQSALTASSPGLPPHARQHHCLAPKQSRGL